MKLRLFQALDLSTEMVPQKLIAEIIPSPTFALHFSELEIGWSVK
jgi:hypothetical protein